MAPKRVSYENKPIPKGATLKATSKPPLKPVVKAPPPLAAAVAGDAADAAPEPAPASRRFIIAGVIFAFVVGALFSAAKGSCEASGFAVTDAKKLTDAGLFTVGPVAISPCNEHLQMKAASKLVPLGFTGASQLHLHRLEIVQITSGSRELGKILEGGIKAASTAEIYGEFHSGKTQLCLTLCITYQVSKSIADAYLKDPELSTMLVLSAMPSCLITPVLQPHDRCFIFASDGLCETKASGFTAMDVEKITDAGLCTVKPVAISPRNELLQLEAASKLVPLGFTSATQLHLHRLEIVQITSGSRELGKILEGGIEAACTAEIYGEFRSGKTQLCLTLCITHQVDSIADAYMKDPESNEH